MNVSFEFEPNIFMLLPGIAFVNAHCECCDTDNWTIQIGWISFVLIIDFGPKHEEE